MLNTLGPRQHGRHFAGDTFKRIFLNVNVIISIKISLRFVPKGPINNIPALVQIMAWRRLGDKPLSEAMMVNLLTHICVTRPQWVNDTGISIADSIVIKQVVPFALRITTESIIHPAYLGFHFDLKSMQKYFWSILSSIIIYYGENSHTFYVAVCWYNNAFVFE